LWYLPTSRECGEDCWLVPAKRVGDATRVVKIGVQRPREAAASVLRRSVPVPRPGRVGLLLLQPSPLKASFPFALAPSLSCEESSVAVEEVGDGRVRLCLWRGWGRGAATCPGVCRARLPVGCARRWQEREECASHPGEGRLGGCRGVQLLEALVLRLHPPFDHCGFACRAAFPLRQLRVQLCCDGGETRVGVEPCPCRRAEPWLHPMTLPRPRRHPQRGLSSVTPWTCST